METKKSKKADLENKRGLFFQMGMIIVLITVIFIFDLSWNSPDTTVIREVRKIIDPDEMPIVDIPEQPQEIALPLISDAINIVDEDIDVIETFNWVVDDPKFKVTEVIYHISPQKAPEEIPDDESHIPVYVPAALLKNKPVFADGDFSAWIGKKVKYPEEAIANHVQGKVLLQFVIDIDGSLTDIKVLRKIDELLAAEAVRVVAMSPKWIPGRQNGKAVRTLYEFPVTFQLN